MSMPEAELTVEISAEQELYDRVFSFRPPLPVGVVDISWIEDEAGHRTADHPGYAWERLPRWLAEIRDTYKNAGQVPVFHIDLGSSIPLYAQHMRALEFKRCDERANEFVRRLKNEHPSVDGGTHELAFLHKEIFSGGKTTSLAQGLLLSALQRVLFTRNLDDMADGDLARAQVIFTQRLYRALQTQTNLYLRDKSHTDIESNWGIKFHDEAQPRTYAEVVADTGIATPVSIEAGKRLGSGESDDAAMDRELARERSAAGRELADKYLYWQAQKLAIMIADDPRLRPARFVSADMADPLEIAVSSVLTTPNSTKRLHLFSHAVSSLFNENLHMRHNLVEPLPVPDNSVTLITCFDAWPFYSTFEDLSDEEVDLATDVAIDMLYSWYEKLAYGGKMVIFPWVTQERDARSHEVLSNIKLWMSLLTGTQIGGGVFHDATLMDIMSESDHQTAARLSPIFASGRKPEVEVLIIEKPNRLLVKRHRERQAERLATASRIRGWQDPTQ
jgi:hypothetical protein